MPKDIHKYKDIREKIISGVDKIAEPVVTTLTPKGTNTIFEAGFGTYLVSNDGITIANQIELEDPVENAVAQIVRESAVRTNAEAGDGTTTSILLTQSIIKEGIKLLDGDYNPMKLKRDMAEIGDIISKNIQKKVKKIKTDKELMFVAQVSANDDEEIAKNVVDAVKAVGEDGLIFVEQNTTEKTEVKKETGFLMKDGMFSPQFTNQPGKLQASYKDVKIFITDKKIYSPEEVISILEPLAKAGIGEVVVVARDFLGTSTNFFLANHLQKKMSILLIKDTGLKDNDDGSLEDLADYVGTKVFSDKAGQLLKRGAVTLESFGTVDRVVSFSNKTIISHPDHKAKDDKIKMLKTGLVEAKKENAKKPIEMFEKRIARMVSGTVTIKVGGYTSQETRERMYRYEDSVNALRISQKHGYVVGGGITLWEAYKASKEQLSGFDSDLVKVMERVCQAPLNRIAINCDIHFPTLMENVENGLGYNASTEVYEDLLKAGIIEPLKVLQLAWENGISSSGIILSSRFIMTEIKEKDGKEEHSPQN